MSTAWGIRVRWGGRCAAAVAAGLAWSAAAPGFYFKGWPGEGVPKKPTLIPPTAASFANPPSGRTFTDEQGSHFDNGPQSDEQSQPRPRPPSPPNGTPEPATAVLALAGAGAVLLRRLRRR